MTSNRKYDDYCSDYERTKAKRARLFRGKKVQPKPDGSCGGCGQASFSYNNGNEFSECGTRGYRCASCGAVKPEAWRLEVPRRG